jgi:hypothetical protein
MHIFFSEARATLTLFQIHVHETATIEEVSEEQLEQLGVPKQSFLVDKYYVVLNPNVAKFTLNGYALVRITELEGSNLPQVEPTSTCSCKDFDETTGVALCRFIYIFILLTLYICWRGGFEQAVSTQSMFVREGTHMFLQVHLY